MDRGAGRRRSLVTGNDNGGGKEMVRSSDGRSFQRRGAVMDMARLEKMRCRAYCKNLGINSLPQDFFTK